MKTQFTNAVTSKLCKVAAMLFVCGALSTQLFAQGKCDAHFTAAPDTGAKYTVLFIPNENAPHATFSWTFGDGNTSIGRIVTNTYTNAGVYYVCLTVADSTCSATWCDSVRVGPPPPPPPHCDAHFGIAADTTANGVRFSAVPNAPNATYAWTFGDGGTSTGKNPTHVYSGPGKYDVCLTVKDSTLCTATFCDSVRVGPPPPPPPHCDAHFGTAPDTGAYGIRFFSAQNAPRATYAWTFGDGGTSTDKNPTHFYSGPGTYDVCVTVTDSTLCTATFCDSVRIKTPPPPHQKPCDAHFRHDGDNNGTVHFHPDPNAPHSYYSWDFADGSTSVKPNPNHTYANTGVYYVCLTVTDSANHQQVCSTTWCDSVHVKVNQKPGPCNAHFIFGPDTTKNGIRFMAAHNAPGTTYSWNFGDGNSSTEANPVNNYADSGVFYVCLTVTDSTICTETWCDSIKVGKFHKRIADMTNVVTVASGSVYPNPITESAVIHIENATGAVTFKMYDLTGRMALIKSDLTNGDFDLNRQDLPVGIYYYELNDANTVFANGKLVIQ